MLFAMTLLFWLHEFMHAAVVVSLKDNTPESIRADLRLILWRISILVGTVLLFLPGLDRAKPVIFNPNYLSRFKSRRAMIIL